MSKKNKAKNKSKVSTKQPKSAAPAKQVAATASKPQSSAPGHWQSYGLDQIAQRLVLDALAADKETLNQSHKMRMATAYGLERFWGEHLRLRNSKKEVDKLKSEYWKAAWDELVEVMGKAGIVIPNQKVAAADKAAVREMSEALWQLEPGVQRVTLSVLTQLCDCLVWWTQRYKGVQ